jgi:hypothetical protein
MTLPHFQALYNHYPAVIALMNQEFTSHEFILRLFQQHQGDFINALHAYRDADAPMRQVTGQLSKQLHEFSDLVRHTGDTESHDIFCDPSRCATWGRV